jgi:hypothetical protein
MWTETEFAQGLNGFHARNRSSLILAGELVYQQAGFSFSRALGKSFRQGVAGLFSKRQMTTDKMLEGHIQATVDRCERSAGEVLVVSQDTTYYNLSGRTALEGLGALQGNLKGTLQHNVLAGDGRGLPLGLLYQRNWTREGLNALDNESEKWLLGLKAVNKHLATSRKRVVLVQDREADIFRFFQADRAANVDLVVRVYHPRKLEVVGDGQIFPLAQAAQQLAPMGALQVDIERHNKTVQLHLEVSAGAVAVLPDKDLSAAKHKVKGLYLVVAREVEALDKEGKSVFDAQQAACWLLLTSYPIQQAQDAYQVVRWYALRWRIERFHYVLKSGGLQIERLQFDDVHTLFNAFAFYSIVAWRVLHLTYQVRQEGQAPVEDYFDPPEVKLLSAKVQQPVKTLEEAIKALGMLVNFQPTKKQPLPGIKILSQAISKLYQMKEAITLFKDFPLQD